MKSILLGIGVATLFSIWGYIDGLVWWQIIPMWIFLFFLVSVFGVVFEHVDEMEKTVKQS